jgi:hypothetical protein
VYFLSKNEYTIFKPVEIIRKEKNKGDEQIWVTININLEMSQ